MDQSIEKTYQKKTQLEHILLRPDTYVGSVEKQSQQLWVMSGPDNSSIEYRNIEYVPGLYKIFDEILVNAADNYQRDKRMNKLQITINQDTNTISVWNNGKGIPIAIHKEYNVYVPELIFGHLLTSSNYDDSIKKVTGGRNGYGAKLTNIFSKLFVVETAEAKQKKKFKMVWRNNMSENDAPLITSYDGDDYTCVTFQPDLHKFGMRQLDQDIISLMCKRVYDMAGVIGGTVKVSLNGTQLKIRGFSDYVDLYLNSNTKVNEDSQQPIKITDNKGTNNERWEIIASVSDGEFQQVSFVNSICTSKGGTHVNYITDQIVDGLMELIKKKEKSLKIKPFQVKNYLQVFITALIENPSFDSQTKETLTLKQQSFGSGCKISEKFIKDMAKSGIIDKVLFMAKAKEQSKMNKQLTGKKQQRLLGVPKLDDANDAGTRLADTCTLIVTEGDSAKALAVAGVEVVGRDKYGVFPLKGKMLNVREASTKQILDNQEIQNIIKTMGLQANKKYENNKSLRYGSIMIMADQDTDGSHIKGLFVNFIQHFWPSLYQLPGFLKEFITPIIKARKGHNQILSFFTVQDYQKWINTISAEELQRWKIKYYKGLGTSTDQEAQEYFSNLNKHQIFFKHQDNEDDEAIDLAFNKKKADQRKDWLAAHDPLLNNVDHSIKQLRYKDFVNKELVWFSIADCERSIPSLVDGLKPGQRKILFACFKRNLRDEIKVAQLSGYVAEHSAYHHGEVSLAQTIIGMAQNFVGSNNINFLLPIGQFGSRSLAGKDAASARYIHTNLNRLTRCVFPEPDDHSLNFVEDDGQRVEPQWYVPILPTVLVNGAEGIGTGWSTSIPQFNPREICDQLLSKLADPNNYTFQEMTPWYKGFVGDILVNPKGSGFLVKGRYNILGEDLIEITEIPFTKCIKDFKAQLEELMVSADNNKEPDIEDVREYHAGNRVHFLVKMSNGRMAQLMSDADSIDKYFKLSTTIQLSNMVLFDPQGKLKKYATVGEIIQDFYDVRIKYYDLRKQFMLSKIQREVEILQNKKRFIMAVINNEVDIKNTKSEAIVQQLIKKGFKAMKDITPVKSNKINIANNQQQQQDIEQLQIDNDNNGIELEDREEDARIQRNIKEYRYLLDMPLRCLTYEEVERLKKLLALREKEMFDLKNTDIKDMWRTDINEFLKNLDVQEEREEKEMKKRIQTTGQKQSQGNGMGKKKPARRQTSSKNMMNNDDNSDADDFIDEDDDDFNSDDEFGGKSKKPQKSKTASSQNADNNNKKKSKIDDNIKVALSQDTGISSKIQKRPPPQILSQSNNNNSQTAAAPYKLSQKEKKKPTAAAMEKEDNNMEEESEKQQIESDELNQQSQKLQSHQPSQAEILSQKYGGISENILKYLEPLSQTSVKSDNNNNNTQTQILKTLSQATKTDRLSLSLEERLMLKAAHGEVQDFDQGYNEIKKSVEKSQFNSQSIDNALKSQKIKVESKKYTQELDDLYDNILLTKRKSSDLDQELEKENIDRNIPKKIVKTNDEDKNIIQSEVKGKTTQKTVNKPSQQQQSKKPRNKKNISDEDEEEQDSIDSFLVKDSDSEFSEGNTKKNNKKKTNNSKKTQQTSKTTRVQPTKKKNDSQDEDEEENYDDDDNNVKDVSDNYNSQKKMNQELKKPRLVKLANNKTENKMEQEDEDVSEENQFNKQSNNNNTEAQRKTRLVRKSAVQKIIDDYDEEDEEENQNLFKSKGKKKINISEDESYSISK